MQYARRAHAAAADGLKLIRHNEKFQMENLLNNDSV